MKKLYKPIKKLLLVGASLLLYANVLAQCDLRMLTDSAEILFNGPVNKMVSGTRAIYAGGDFSLVGKWTGALAQLDRNTGRPLLSAGWPRAAGKMYGCLKDASGNTIVFGSFTTLGGYSRTNLGSFDASLQVTPLNVTLNGDVNAAAVAAGILYIGGYFTTVNGVPRNRLAAIDLATGNITSWNPNITNSGPLPCRIECMMASGANLYIGGAFSNIGASARRNIAAVSLSTGAATGWAPEAYFSTSPSYGTVTKMLKVNNLLFICGQFDYAGGQSRPDAAAIDLTTAAAASWTPNTNSVIYALANKGDTLYVGGIFTQVASLPRQSFAAYSISGNSILPITINTTQKFVDAVYDILAVGDTIFLAGKFDTVNGQFRKNIASFNRLTGAVLPFEGHANDVVNSLTLLDGKLHAGGSFFSAGMKPRANLVEIDKAGDTVTTFNMPVDGPVTGMAIKNNTLYLSGDFTKVKDSLRRYNAAIDIASRKVTAWDIKADSTFNDMEFYKGDVYIGGDFSKINGSARDCIAKLDGGGNLQPWTSALGVGGVNAFELYKDTLYVGTNSAVNGLNLISGATVTTPLGGVTAMCHQDSMLYVSQLGGLKHSELKALDLTTKKIPLWTGVFSNSIYDTQVLFDDRVNDMIFRSNKIYVAGLFRKVVFTRHDMTPLQPKPVYQFDTLRGGICVIIPPIFGTNQPYIDIFNPNLANSGTNSMAILGNKMYLGGIMTSTTGGYSKAALFVIPNTLLDVSMETDTNNFCAGTQATISTQSTVTYGTTYDWYVNGTKVGNTLPYYAFKPSNGDSVSCIMKAPANGCTFDQYDTANSIIYHVIPVVTPTISIAGPAEEDSGKQVTVRATVLNAADHYTIEWFNKGVSMGKTTVDSISYIKGNGTDSIYAVITPRTDTCYVTDTSGTVYINQKPEGISNIDGDESIMVYPNPFGKFVRIRGLQERDIIMLYDITGRKILTDEYHAQTAEYTIASGYLKTGTYVLKITDRNGTSRKNILIQKQE